MGHPSGGYGEAFSTVPSPPGLTVYATSKSPEVKVDMAMYIVHNIRMFKRIAIKTHHFNRKYNILVIKSVIEIH